MAFQSKYTGSQVEALLDKVNTGTLDVWLPSVTTAGQISWTKSNSQTVPATRNIMGPVGPIGPQGKPGSDGGVGLTGPTGPVNNSLWYPTVAANGDISWAKSTSATTPTARNIRGPVGLTGPTGPAGVVPTVNLNIDEADQGFNYSIFTTPGVYVCNVNVTNKQQIQLSSGKGLAIISAVSPDLVGVLLYGNQYISLTGGAIDDYSYGLEVLNGPINSFHGFYQEFNSQISM